MYKTTEKNPEVMCCYKINYDINRCSCLFISLCEPFVLYVPKVLLVSVKVIFYYTICLGTSS